MLNARHLIATVLVGLALAPAGAAFASADHDRIADLAFDAAQATTQEQELLHQLTSPQADTSRAATLVSLMEVDSEGTGLLVQLDQLGVRISEAARVALAPLPDLDELTVEEIQFSVPRAVVYDAAITDLLRVSSTPAAATSEPPGSANSSFGLLLVAAAALVLLGVAALVNTLQRQPDSELEAMAWSDGLTGLFNRRRLDHDVAQRVEAGQPTAAIMIDVDHFKIVNDTFGHQIGDDVLRQVGELLTTQVRSDDVVYRYGGEEFCILLPGANRSDAQTVADRIVRAARGVELPNGDNLTVSVGISDAATELDRIIENADQALFVAKAQGRDRAVHAVDVVTAR